MQLYTDSPLTYWLSSSSIIKPPINGYLIPATACKKQAVNVKIGLAAINPTLIGLGLGDLDAHQIVWEVFCHTLVTQKARVHASMVAC